MKSIWDGWKVIAAQDSTGQWWKVVVGCQRCGECCTKRPTHKNWPRYMMWVNKEGRCKYLAEEPTELGTGVMRCNLLNHAPLTCHIIDPDGMQDYCKIRLEKTDDYRIR